VDVLEKRGKSCISLTASLANLSSLLISFPSSLVSSSKGSEKNTGDFQFEKVKYPSSGSRRPIEVSR